MMGFRFLILVVGCFVTMAALSTCPGDEPPRTGPATENRFPPLKVPAGFQATLFACDPLIEYPSAISAGPRPGAIFVAVDYMTGLGTEIVRRSEVRLVEDTNEDGYADRASVYAGGFNSIMGLAWHRDTLFVMHAPLLTALRDTAGAGVADERKDIVRGLGLSPEENPVRLHCANGVAAGHDGWLYLALGDHGCNVQRPEGDRLVLEGGGILRCRTDGSGLHIFSMGLRNIYDVALDAELNVLVRDNENDGGDYKIRVCHSFFGADHGYPYLYYEDPAECLRPLADLGLGSSAGGTCYLERQFPPEYRGNLFFCEWGKSLVHYALRRSGSRFATPQEMEFAVGAVDDPYGFKPTDVVVQRDGSLMVSDYADGQRPKRGRGRIYHIAYGGDDPRDRRPVTDDPITLLNSDSYYDRCEAQVKIERAGEQGLKLLTEALAAGRVGVQGRLHAVWILATLQGAESVETLFNIAETDPAQSVRAQAVRVIADYADPVLAKRRLNAGRGDPELAARLAALGQGSDRRVSLEVIVALGRLRWPRTADWLKDNLRQPDAALAHAAMQALRQSRNWPAVLTLLDAPSGDLLRDIALRAASRQYDEELVDGLLKRLSGETDATRLREYTSCLSRVYKKPGPWVYWDYRPKPRPPNTVSWERTEAIATALNRVLSHDDRELRLAALTQMQQEKIPASLTVLETWLRQDTAPQHVAAILHSLRDRPPVEVHRYLAPVIREPLNSSANRLTALSLYAQGIDAEHADELLRLAEGMEDGPVLAETLRLLGKYPRLAAVPMLVSKAKSALPEVRAAAIQSLGDLRAEEGRAALAQLLADPDPQVRRAAADAAGKLEALQASESLLKLAADRDGTVRAASLRSLRQLKETRAVPLALAALEDRQTDLIALELLRELGGAQHAQAVVRLATHHPSLDVITRSVQALTEWRHNATAAQQQALDHAVAEIQGSSGSLVRWQVSGPMKNLPADLGAVGDDSQDSRLVHATGLEGRVQIETPGAENETWLLARTEVAVSDPADVEVLASSDGSLRVWLNGKSIHERKQPPNVHSDTDRIGTTLATGMNHFVVALKIDAPQSPLKFQLRFRRKSNVAAREQYTAAALARPGNPQRGRSIFLDTEKSLCAKCHRMNDLGERIGPELTGLGSRFSRIHIVESILDPGRSIAPSYGTSIIQLRNGQVLAGIKAVDSETTLTLVDNQGQKHLLMKDEIEEQHASPLSTMPEGLEKRLTQQEFVDLVAFLTSEVEKPPP